MLKYNINEPSIKYSHREVSKMVDAKTEAQGIIAEFRDETGKLRSGPHEIHALRLMTLVSAGGKLTVKNQDLGKGSGFKSEVQFENETWWCVSKNPIQFD